MATNASPYPLNPYPDSIGSKQLSIALISPNLERRVSSGSGTGAVLGRRCDRVSQLSSRDWTIYPGCWSQKFDVVIIELDSDPEYALELVESIGKRRDGDGDGVFGERRSGAPGALHARRRARVSDASAGARSDGRGAGTGRGAAAGDAGHEERRAGRLLAFMGAKGGAGATMLACNFAVGLAKESDEKTLLIDLDLPLGDAALNLGIVPEFSTIDALDAAERTGRGISFTASGKAQFGPDGAGGAGKVCSLPDPTTTRSIGCCMWRARSSTTWWLTWDRSWT